MSQRAITLRIILALGFAAAYVRGTSAAEIVIRPECVTAQPMVTLGDLAAVIAADPQASARLAALEIMPAPPPGATRFLRVREIQDVLWLRGVNLAEHRMSGAAQVAITRVTAAAPTAPAPPAAIRAAVVVTRRALARGTTVSAEDVELAESESAPAATDGCGALAEAVGMELLQSLPAGAAVPRSALAAAVMVRRGELVTVSVRAPGMRIETKAKARDDGGPGDVVAVETLADRKPYFVRVVGRQRVEPVGGGPAVATVANHGEGQ